MGKVTSHMSHNCTWFHDFLTKNESGLIMYELKAAACYMRCNYLKVKKVSVGSTICVYIFGYCLNSCENQDQQNNLCCRY